MRRIKLSELGSYYHFGLISSKVIVHYYQISYFQVSFSQSSIDCSFSSTDFFLYYCLLDQAPHILFIHYNIIPNFNYTNYLSWTKSFILKTMNKNEKQLSIKSLVTGSGSKSTRVTSAADIIKVSEREFRRFRRNEPKPEGLEDGAIEYSKIYSASTVRSCMDI